MNLIMTRRATCELETYSVAVERIKEYTEAPTEVIVMSSMCIRESYIFTLMSFGNLRSIIQHEVISFSMKSGRKGR